MLNFDSQKDCCRWLHDSICRYKQEIVYVTVDQGAKVNEIHVLPFGGKKQKILCTDPDFSVHMPELGYINCEDNAFYLQRKPLRAQRAGVCRDMCNFKNNRVPYNGMDYLTQPEGYNMLMDLYPTFRDAHKAVDWNNVKGMAFSKHLAVVMTNRYSRHIEYKGEIAALWNPAAMAYYIPQPRKDTSFIKAILVRNGVDL